MNFNEKLQKLRKEQKLSQEELADKLDVTRQSVSKWESGQTYPEMDKLLAICKIFNCTLEELTNDEININEFNKETKTNIVNYILEYIKRVYYYFTHISFKEFVKLVLTIIILHIILHFVHFPFIELENIIRNATSYLKESFITHFINGVSAFIIDLVYSLGSLFLVFYIFTIGFLDKSTYVEESLNSESNEESKKEDKNISTLKSSPKNESKIIDGIGMIVMFFVKLFLIFFAVPFVLLIVFLSFCLAIDISLIFQGVLSFGVTLGLIFAISLVGILIEFITNIVLNHKHNAKKMIAVLLISLIGGGISSGILTLELSRFEIIDGTPTIVKQTKDTYNFTYHKGLTINSGYGYNSHPEESMKDNEIRIEVTNYEFKDYIYLIEDKETSSINIQRTVRDNYKISDYYDIIVASLKEKKIYSFYDNPESKIVIYANTATLRKLETNRENAQKLQEQERLNTEIDNLKESNNELNNRIETLQKEKNDLEEINKSLQRKIDDYQSKIESLLD